MNCFFVTITPNSLVPVVTSSPMMQSENFRPHGPGVTPDDVVWDCGTFLD